MNLYGYFDDEQQSYVIKTPVTPRPWINYIGNMNLNAFISQNAGGLMWYLEPYTNRITRYHYTAAPSDRPGFYIYIKDHKTGKIWNPHFAPTCMELDRFECAHSPGITSFFAEKDGVKVNLKYGIPQEDNVMLWDLDIENTSDDELDIQVVSYIEFGLLEFMREAIGWCYLKNQFSLTYDSKHTAIRYDYHVFEAPSSPAMAFGCNAKVSGYECSRDLFIGTSGDYGRPAALMPANKLSNSELPEGGHGCGVLGVDLKLKPGMQNSFSYIFALGDNDHEVNQLLKKYKSQKNVEDAFCEISNFWKKRLDVFQLNSGDSTLDRFVNIWNPYNAMIALQYARTISTDHMGTDGLRFRDTSQDALAVANIDPDFSLERMRQVFEQQNQDGSGCMSFFPNTNRKTTDYPRRSDNSVWQVYTIKNLIAETGDFSILENEIPFRDAGTGTIYNHLLSGLKLIYENCGKNGLPLLFHADWNDGLALFEDEKAESVMLGMQLVFSCREFRELAESLSNKKDVAWCDSVIEELTEKLNSDIVWDGKWYRRLILSNGKVLGSSENAQGKIYLNPQSWAVISGVASPERGQFSMNSVAKFLDSDCGLSILTPPFKGFPEPEDPPKGANPGIGENGGIFCHANTWAIIAECLLENAERAFKYYRQILPESVILKFGGNHYECEPYAYVSSIIGPRSDNFGRGGISWLTGTSSWMYIAITQYILGIRPTLEGLMIKPCLPELITQSSINRRYRECDFKIQIDNQKRQDSSLVINGKSIKENTINPEQAIYNVICKC